MTISFAVLSNLIKSDSFDKHLYKKRLKGTAIFIIVGGCSVLVWLIFIITAIIKGQTIETIDVYTTEPTFVIDLSIVLPSALFCRLMLLKQKPIGYKIAPVLLTLISGVDLCVIFQTIVQNALGIILPIGQIIGLAVSFIILGIAAIVLNVRLLKYTG